MKNKRSKAANVPNLRFPGFEGEWGIKKLGEVGEIVNGLTYSPNDISENGVLVLRSSNVKNRSLTFEDNVFVVTDSFNPVLEGDILICVRNGSRSLIGKNALIFKENEGLAFGAFMAVYRSRYNDFLFHWFDTSQYKEEVSKNLGATINSINGSDLRKFKVPFPGIAEQKKIAQFLALLDIRIATQRKIIEELKLLIQNLRTQLFNQTLKFKDEKGKDFQKWERKTLGQIATKQSTKNKDNNISCVYTNSANKGILNQKDFFDKDIANPYNLLNYSVVEKNDFVYNPRISTLAPVGPISRNHLDTGVMSPLYSVFRINEGNLDFFEIYFSTNCWHEHMKNVANYGARHDRMAVSVEDFYLMPLPFPCLEEQIRIAAFIISLSNKVKLETNLIVEYEQQKNFFLKELFI